MRNAVGNSVVSVVVVVLIVCAVPNNSLAQGNPLDGLGRRTLKAGDHVLRFECVGRNAASKGYFLGMDCLQARVPVYARPESTDLRDIQAKP